MSLKVRLVDEGSGRGWTEETFDDGYSWKQSDDGKWIDILDGAAKQVTRVRAEDVIRIDRVNS